MTMIAPPPPTEPAADRPGPVDPPLTVLEPPRGFEVIDIPELWKARELVFFLAWRDVKVRYKQTALGAAWAILQPLLMMIVFSIFFGRLAGIPSGGLPYPLFALTGLLPWTFFAAAVTAAANSVIASERLITKVYFPRLAVPLASIGSAVVDFAFACLLLGLIMCAYGARPGPGIVLAPLCFATIALLALGLGTLLAALNVAYRDFKYIIPLMIQLGMFATPTVYMDPSAASRGRFGWLLALNPMTTLVATFRSTVLGGPIAWGPLAVAAIASALAFVAGALYFRRVESSFADVI